MARQQQRLNMDQQSQRGFLLEEGMNQNGFLAFLPCGQNFFTGILLQKDGSGFFPVKVV